MERAPVTHWIGGRVGPRAILITVVSSMHRRYDKCTQYFDWKT